MNHVHIIYTVHAKNVNKATIPLPYLTTLLPYPSTLPYLTPHYHTITLLYPATLPYLTPHYHTITLLYPVPYYPTIPATLLPYYPITLPYYPTLLPYYPNTLPYYSILWDFLRNSSIAEPESLQHCTATKRVDHL